VTTELVTDQLARLTAVASPRTRSELDTLDNNAFDPRSISEIDWTEAMRRVGTKDGFHG